MNTQPPGRPPTPHTSASPPLPPRSPRILDLPLPRPLISSKGLTGSLQPPLLPPTSTRQTLKRPILPPFFPQNPVPTQPLNFPPISPTGLPHSPTLFPPTSVTTQSQIASLPPTILPAVSPHPVFKRDYGGLHYDEYAEYHYHDEVYHTGEESVVQTIESISSEEAATYLPSTFPQDEEELFPSKQGPGLDPVPFPLPASSATTSGCFQFTLLLLLASTLWVREFLFRRVN